MERAIFGAGCFWGVEAAFRKLEGVQNTEVGYSGGATKNPTYEQVCSKTTGHAEVVGIDFDETKIRYKSLLEIFWQIHDPTTKDRQGPDIGSQYRSVIFYMDDAQRESAEQSKNDREASGAYTTAIVTEISPAKEFYRAEEYHQQYFEKQGITGGGCHTSQ